AGSGAAPAQGRHGVLERRRGVGDRAVAGTGFGLPRDSSRHDGAATQPGDVARVARAAAAPDPGPDRRPRAGAIDDLERAPRRAGSGADPAEHRPRRARRTAAAPPADPADDGDDHAGPGAAAAGAGPDGPAA